MQASSSLPAITYSSSVLFPSSGGGSSAHTSKREARAAAHTTRATPEAWTEVKGLAKQSNTHLEQTEAKERALAELHHVLRNIHREQSFAAGEGNEGAAALVALEKRVAKAEARLREKEQRNRVFAHMEARTADLLSRENARVDALRDVLHGHRAECDELKSNATVAQKYCRVAESRAAQERQQLREAHVRWYNRLQARRSEHEELVRERKEAEEAQRRREAAAAEERGLVDLDLKGERDLRKRRASQVAEQIVLGMKKEVLASKVQENEEKLRRVKALERRASASGSCAGSTAAAAAAAAAAIREAAPAPAPAAVEAPAAAPAEAGPSSASLAAADMDVLKRVGSSTAGADAALAAQVQEGETRVAELQAARDVVQGTLDKWRLEGGDGTVDRHDEDEKNAQLQASEQRRARAAAQVARADRLLREVLGGLAHLGSLCSSLPTKGGDKGDKGGEHAAADGVDEAGGSGLEAEVLQSLSSVDGQLASYGQTWFVRTKQQLERAATAAAEEQRQDESDQKSLYQVLFRSATPARLLRQKSMLDENSPLPLRPAPEPAASADDEGGFVFADDTPDSPPPAPMPLRPAAKPSVGFSNAASPPPPSPPAPADGPVLSAEANIRIKLDDDEAEEVDSEGDGEGGGDDADADGAGARPPTREDLKAASRRASRRSTRKNSETGRARRASAVKPR